MKKKLEQSMLDKAKTKVDSTHLLGKFAYGQKINQTSKTILKVHRNHPYIKRHREFNEQYSIEPYEGLKEIIDKKSINGILKDIKTRIKQMKKEKEMEEMRGSKKRYLQ